MSDGASTPRKQGLAAPWEPGRSGNPAGRPKGARSKLGEGFLSALHDDFLEHGVGTIEAVRLTDPVAYIRICASLLPKEVRISDEHELSDSELDERIKQLAAFLDLRIEPIS